MDEVAAQLKEFRGAIKSSARSYEVSLNKETLRRLTDYYELLLTWNARMHLVAPCSASEFATRHVLESLMLLKYLRPSARVADIGSGAGLPLIPNLIARPDIQATMIEAARKKAVFLREALRKTGTSSQASVQVERFEDLPTPTVDYVTCRALDRFTEMLPSMVHWCPRDSTLLLFGGDTLRTEIEEAGLECSSVSIPQSERRYLFVCQYR